MVQSRLYLAASSTVGCSLQDGGVAVCRRHWRVAAVSKHARALEEVGGYIYIYTYIYVHMYVYTPEMQIQMLVANEPLLVIRIVANRLHATIIAINIICNCLLSVAYGLLSCTLPIVCRLWPIDCLLNAY